jgi:uncharacterized RDD family membrane protein YckC
MNCPVCSEDCRCQVEAGTAPLAQAGPEVAAEGATPVETAPIAAESGGTAAHGESSGGKDDASAWRDELSVRLSRYRAKRKMRPPRYPSLRLQFDPAESRGNANAVAAQSPVFESVSDHALALDSMMQHPSAPAETDGYMRQEPVAESAPPAIESPGHSAKTAKIIEFPRFAWGPPPPPPDELAEPVGTRPRILEAPEIVPPAPALGGITIEAAERDEPEKRPGIDIPLQSASLGRRVLAGSVDGLIVLLASALFGGIFWKVAAVRPPLLQLLGMAAGVLCVLWAAYQYLLIVYNGSTPGLRAARLELARFNGTSTNRRLRRWRVLAACLSGVSLGMGYAWVFLDEDALCWHDRITHTYLAPGKSNSESGLRSNSLKESGANEEDDHGG